MNDVITQAPPLKNEFSAKCYLRAVCHLRSTNLSSGCARVASSEVNPMQGSSAFGARCTHPDIRPDEAL
jgi:hypothetical protein